MVPSARGGSGEGLAVGAEAHRLDLDGHVSMEEEPLLARSHVPQEDRVSFDASEGLAVRAEAQRCDPREGVYLEAAWLARSCVPHVHRRRTSDDEGLAVGAETHWAPPQPRRPLEGGEFLARGRVPQAQTVVFRGV